MKCPEAKAYREGVNKRKEKEIQTLANLTNWDTKYIRTKIEASDKGGFFTDITSSSDTKWWNNIWPED